MYGELFSKIYNEFGWNYYPEAFAEQLLAWIAAHKPGTRSILDLGCGTGVLCRILREKGLEADGVDLSENMVAIAREADPDGRYETGDMTCYHSDRRYDLVTITGDAINHLTDIRDVEKTFRNIAGLLEDDGVLIFDLLSEKEISDPEPIEFDYDETTKASFRMLRKPDGTVTLRISVSRNGKALPDEVIRERIYEVREICSLLEKSGFSDITCSHRLLDDDGAPVPTWYVTASMAPSFNCPPD